MYTFLDKLRVEHYAMVAYSCKTCMFKVSIKGLCREMHGECKTILSCIFLYQINTVNSHDTKR